MLFLLVRHDAGPALVVDATNSPWLDHTRSHTEARAGVERRGHEKQTHTRTKAPPTSSRARKWAAGARTTTHTQAFARPTLTTATDERGVPVKT